MSNKTLKKQYFFTDPQKVNAILSANGQHDRETLYLLRKVMGRKLLPLQPVAIPAPLDRTGPYDDVNYVTVDPQLVSPALRRKIDLVAEWIKTSSLTGASWLSRRTPDGQIPALSRGFDKAVAEAHRHFYGTKPRSTKAYEPAIQGFQTISHNGATIHNNDPLPPLTVRQMTDILSFNILDAVKIGYARTARDPELTDILPHIDFQVEGRRSRTLTRWRMDPSTGVTHFMGWRGNDITKQLFANRLALATVLACPVHKSFFGNVGAHAFARYGFLPLPQSWDHARSRLRNGICNLVENYDVHESDIEKINAALSKDDPRGMWDLVDIPTRINGKPLSYILAQQSGLSWAGEFNLNNAEQTERARAYIGAAVYDAAMNNALAVVSKAAAPVHQTASPHNICPKLG